MSKISNFFKNIFHNKAIAYIISRYATYLVQFINSLFIAAYLGPYYLGVWGFITLIIQYLKQINLGISHSANVIISIHKKRQWYIQKVAGASFTMIFILSLVVALFFIITSFFDFNIGSKYGFSKYAPIVLIIAILGHFNTLLSNISRIFGRVAEIAINQSAFPVFMLFAILLFKGEYLLWALVIANLAAFLISFIIFLIRNPIKLKPVINLKLMKVIQVKGWYLFVYNTSFYLIIISIRTIISKYYEVTEFGYFTFAFSLANTILLLLKSFSFLILPKILNRFANLSNKNNIVILNKLRDTYITTSHLMAHFALLCFPFLIIFLPKYENSIEAFVQITLTVVLFTNAFGYSGLLMAKGMEKKLGYYSLMALIFNVILAIVFSVYLSFPFSFVIIATMITYFFYVYLLGYEGRKLLGLKTSFVSVFFDIYPIRLLLPYFISLILSIYGLPALYYFISLFLFIALNYKILLSIPKQIKNIIINPKVIDV